MQTFEENFVLKNPRNLEQTVLKQFSDSGYSSSQCGKCGAKKPPVGRTGVDGLTEVRHLKCYPDLPDFFEKEWTQAERIKKDEFKNVKFHPQQLKINGYQLVREAWRQLPLKNPEDYPNIPCNVLCVRGISAQEVIEFLDSEWEKGSSNLRGALWNKFGESVCNMHGKPSPNSKGSGAKGEIFDVQEKLFQMTKFSDANVLLLTVRNPGILYAFIPNR